MNLSLSRVLAYALSVALLLALWQLATFGLRLGFSDTASCFPAAFQADWACLGRILSGEQAGPKANALPGPWQALQVLAANWKEIGRHFLASAGRVVASLALALLIAGPIGLVIGHERRLNRWLSPLIYTTYPIPKVVFLPLLFLLLGIGNAPKVTLITLVVAFQVLLSARDAAGNLDKTHILSVLSAGASRWQVYRHVVLPASLPAILTAARVSVGLAIATLYLAETFATRYGLGKYINEAYDVFGFSRMFAGILAMGLLGLLLYILLDLLERWLCRWKYI